MKCNSSYEKLSEELRDQAKILQTLFPGLSIADLKDKSKEELLAISSSNDGQRFGSSTQSYFGQHHHNESSGDDESYQQLENDESAPLSENGDAPAERRWDESLDKPETVAIDDINAIGLATENKARSYLGISSMSAAFRAIFKLYPPTKEQTAQRAKDCAATPASVHMVVPTVIRDPAMSLLREQRCIEFYFDHFHASTPLIDEDDFRRQYVSGNRSDRSWMGLLNMVLCLGSIASGSDNLHEEYYREARSFFSLDTLGSGNLYSLQALTLLGGQYLHYRNSPNMAYGIMGAAQRVAIALGLHREPRRQHTQDAEELRRAEIRRRTWWSLFCMDVWACMTQGRPTCGRWDGLCMDTALPSALGPEDHVASSLYASAQFCLICDRIEHRLAKLGKLSAHDILSFDHELKTWFDALPSTLRRVDTSTHPRLQVARDLIRTRYFNARVVLARCMILLLAQDWKRKIIEVAPEQRQTIEQCCLIAAEAIDAIVLYWTPTRFQIWSSSWYLFQACTVPLLAMAMERNTHTTSSSKEFTAWQESLAKALAAFSEMRPWMRVSDRSPDIVSAMYEALTAEAEGVMRTPSNTDGSLDLFGWCDEQLAEMDWTMFLGDEAIPALPLAGI